MGITKIVLRRKYIILTLTSHLLCVRYCFMCSTHFIHLMFIMTLEASVNEETEAQRSKGSHTASKQQSQNWTQTIWLQNPCTIVTSAYIRTFKFKINMLKYLVEEVGGMAQKSILKK